MERKATTFDTLPAAMDYLLARIDELEAKIEQLRHNKQKGTTTHIFINEAAELVGKTTSTIYKLAKAGKIPAYKNGKQWNFVKEELEAWMLRMPSHKTSYLPIAEATPSTRTSATDRLIKPKRGRKPSPSIF